MARNAINRNFALLMARYAKAHRVIHCAHRHRLLRHIAVARGAVHSRANMRCVIEFHMRRLLKPVNALPRNILSFGLIRGDFLDFWIRGIDGDMARHAEVRAWKARIWSLFDAHVAKHALQLIRQVDFVRERDRLDGRGTNAEKFADRIGRRTVGRRINAGVFSLNRCRRRRLRVGRLQGREPCDDARHTDHTRNARQPSE